MTRETSLLLLQSGWIYLGLTIAVVIVFVLSWLYGTPVRRKLNKESVEVSSIFITSIFGFFCDSGCVPAVWVNEHLRDAA